MLTVSTNVLSFASLLSRALSVSDVVADSLSLSLALFLYLMLVLYADDLTHSLTYSHTHSLPHPPTLPPSLPLSQMFCKLVLGGSGGQATINIWAFGIQKRAQHPASIERTERSTLDRGGTTRIKTKSNLWSLPAP